MGKVKEYLCSAFEDICKAEKEHNTTHNIQIVRDCLKRAYPKLGNYGEVDPWLMSSNMLLWDAWSIERYVFEHAMNCINFILEECQLTEAFQEYRKDYFNLS